MCNKRNDEREEKSRSLHVYREMKNKDKGCWQRGGGGQRRGRTKARPADSKKEEEDGTIQIDETKKPRKRPG